MITRLSDTEEGISNLEDRLVEIIQSEDIRKKSKFLKKQLRKDLLHNIVPQHSYYSSSRRRREREGEQKCIWRNYTWKLLKPEVGNRYPIQQAQKVSNKMNPNRPTPWCIIIMAKDIRRLNETRRKGISCK